MKTATFYKAVSEIVEEGASIVYPFMNGEPLADPRMVGFVGWMATEFPTLEVGWYTNAFYLTADKAEGLLRHGNIKGFNISMQGGTKEVYERNTRLPWDRVIENVETLIKINRSLGSPAVVHMNMCLFSATAGTEDEFKKRWEDLGCSVCLGAFSNFGGLSRDAVGEEPWLPAPRKVCNRATAHAYVYWNGDVGQCCFDLMGSVVWGNLERQKLREVLDTPAYQRMREAHLEISVPDMPAVCKECNACKFNG